MQLLQLLSAVLYTLLAQSRTKIRQRNKSLTSPATVSSVSVNKYQRNQLQRQLQWMKQNADKLCLFMDFENVRGKSKFELSHLQLLQQTWKWTQYHKLPMIFIVDHGSIAKGYCLGNQNLGIVFGGQRLKADDIIARDVTYGNNVLVITADRELMSRCRTAFYSREDREDREEEEEEEREIQFMHPLTFINNLEMVQHKKLDNNESIELPTLLEEDSVKKEDENELNNDLLKNIKDEIQIRGAMYSTEALMKQKKQMNTPKKRRKLQKRARMLVEKLAMKGGMANGIHQLTTPSLNNLQFQNKVLYEWEQLRRNATSPELTGDRMMLAEYFRRQIERKVSTDEQPSSSTATGIVQEYIQYINEFQTKTKSLTSASSGSSSFISKYDQDLSLTNRTTLRLVIVSDTHGYEEALTPNGNTLPNGDVLLHLGDFAIDAKRKKKKGLERFDEWLQDQPHGYKIVLKGNHDPFSVRFPKSQAIYVNRPQCMVLENILSLTLIPYCSDRILHSSWRKFAAMGDILASHVPPHNVLDTCYNGKHAGCPILKKKVETSLTSPKVWLCGHIHEGFGFEQRHFGIDQKATLVMNVANANTGRANSLQHGPTIVDIDTKNNNEVSSYMQCDLQAQEQEAASIV